jgi:DNA helicase IV
VSTDRGAKPKPGIDTTPEDALVAESNYLVYARKCLAGMLAAVRSLEIQGGDPVSTEYLKTELARRADALREVPGVPLFFGRIDRESTAEQFHIGRRHVRNGGGDVVVVDWRADVSLAFYQATAADAMDVSMRRRFGHAAGTLTSLEDEHLAAGEEHDALATGGILAAEIERPRVGPMRDIVATIAPDQDTLVRAPLEQTTCIQGAPGTGKTAVGLHRAAYLLYAHREQLRRTRVLVVGPNRSFLSYIGELLPALGEVDVQQVVVDELVAGVTVRGHDNPDVARLKGDPRFAAVIERAVHEGIRTPTQPLVVAVGSRRWRLPPDELADLMQRERSGAVPYGVIRGRLPTLLAESLRRRSESAGGSPDDAWVTRLARSAPIKEFVDAHWPAVSAKAVVAGLLSDPAVLSRLGDGLLEVAEQGRLLDASAGSAGRSRWSRADAFLIDEAAAHISRPASYGHLVVDEAQDLSAMQCRALGRRCEAGSATVLGDVAQATAPEALADWDEALRHLGKPQASIVALTRGYRVPQEVLELANRLLPSLAAGIEPATSIRHAPASLRLRPSASMSAAVTAAVIDRLAQEGSIGVIATPADLLTVSRALAGADIVAGRVEDGMDRRVELVPVTLCKGLEFDHVVVVEPAGIARSLDRGLHWLYVALTRAVSSLDVVHCEPLPAELITATGS